MIFKRKFIISIIVKNFTEFKKMSDSHSIITELTQQAIPLPMLLFLMLFSLGIALFHYIIFSGLLKMNGKIAGLFFILNPSILLITWLVNPNYVLLVLLSLFLSVFVFAIVAMFVSIFSKKEDRDEYESNKSFNEKYNVKRSRPKSAFYKEIAVVVSFFALGGMMFYYFKEAGIVLTFLLVFVVAKLASSNNKRFLKFQRNLPTSKVRSVAMGMAELQGNCKMIKSVNSPLSNKECIGFRYKIEDIKTDKDGDTSYTTRLDKTVCEDFMLQDDTGSILVKGENISLIWIEEDSSISEDRQRFTEYLLKNKKEVLLIGNVSLEENKPIVGYDSYNKTFGVSSVDKLALYNDSVPLMNSAKVYAVILVLLIALILITPISLKGHKLIIEKPQLNFFNAKKETSQPTENLEYNINEDSAEEAPAAVQK